MKQPLLSNGHGHGMEKGKGKQAGQDMSPRSEFSRMAAGIGKDIAKTTANLGKLAQCESVFHKMWI